MLLNMHTINSKFKNNRSTKYSCLNIPVFLAALIWLIGCTSQLQPHPDSLAGWTFRSFDAYAPPADQKNYQLDKAVVDDYQAFVRDNKLSLNGALTGFYEDGTGQHAISFEASPNNQNFTWHYILIYDRNDKRVNAVKRDYHKYQS